MNRRNVDKKYSVLIYWSDAYGHYISSVPEFGILADGDTREEALKSAETVIEACVEIEMEDGGTPPDPILWESK
jgi:predicted RNase H-like HicB family nuclease